MTKNKHLNCTTDSATLSGFMAFSYDLCYNHISPSGFKNPVPAGISVPSRKIGTGFSGLLSLSYDLSKNHISPSGFTNSVSVRSSGWLSGFSNPVRDDMIIELLINKQLNPVGVK
jgi:hypothetical protein